MVLESAKEGRDYAPLVEAVRPMRTHDELEHLVDNFGALVRRLHETEQARRLRPRYPTNTLYGAPLAAALAIADLPPAYNAAPASPEEVRALSGCS